MRASIVRDIVILLTVFGSIWVVFVYVPIFPNTEDITIPIDKEEQLGKLILKNIISQEGNFSVVNDSVLDFAMLTINTRLTNNIGLTDYQHNIIVVNNEEINAITLPGANILVFSGLINFTETPEELAAVIAHEIGHVEHRHVVSKLLKEFTVTIIFGILTGADPTLLGEITKSSVSRVFDRRQEKEADDYGLQLLEKSRISPRSMAAFFRRMSREKGNYDKRLEIIMTHPHNNSRIKASMEYTLDEKFKSEDFGLDWERVKERLHK